MTKSSFLAFCVLVNMTGCVKRAPQTNDLKIAGGEDVIEEDPIAKSSVAMYKWFSKHDKVLTYNCGATLISPTAAITAAHCVRGWPHGGYQIVLGPRVQDGELSVTGAANHERVFFVADENIKTHPAYDEDAYDSPDLAILHLSRAVPSHYKPAVIAQADHVLSEGATLTLASYGPTFRDGEDTGILRQLVMPLTGKDPKATSGKKLLLKGISGAPGSTGCPGDSGGSVYQKANDKLILVGVLTGGKHGCLSREDGDNINVVHDLRGEGEWLRQEVKDLPAFSPAAR